MSDFKNIGDLLKHKADTEKFNQQLWFESLLERLDSGDIEAVRYSIESAIKLLGRKET